KQDQHTQTEASGDEYESLENLLLELQTENASLVKSQQSIMEKLQDSVKKVAHYKTLHENAERLADENLNECIVELQGNEQWLLDEITAKDMEIACLSKQLDQSMIRLARTERSQIRKLRDTESIFKREETRMIEKIEALEADVSVLTEAKTAAEKQTTAKINALESQIKGLKSAIQPSSVPSELQLKVTTLQNELASKDRQIAEMRAASDSMVDLQKQNSESLKAEVETLKNRLLLVEAGHLQYREDADITISGLKKQITELLEMDRPNASLERIEDESSDKLDTSESNLHRDVNFFKNKMESLLIVEVEKEKSIHALKLNIQEIEETNSASISNLNAEIFQLSQKLEQRDGEQKVLVDLVREKNDAKLQLILENEKLTDTIKEHEKLSREAKKTASAKQQQSSVAIQINGTEFDEKRTALESRISELEATADRDVSEISRLNNVIRIQSHAANSWEASKTDLESQIQAKNLLLSDQEAAIDRLSKELVTTSLQASQAVERVENLELRLEEIARVQAGDPSTVNDALFEVDRLQDEINALRAQLEATTKLLTEERQSLEAEKERRLTLLSEHLIQVARLEVMIEAASTFGALNDSDSFNRNSMEDDFTCSSQDNSDPTYAQSEGSRSCDGLTFERAESLEGHFEEVPLPPESNSNVPRSKSETVLDAPKSEALNISLERGESEKQLFPKDEKQTLTQDEESGYIFTVQDIKARNRADSFKSSQIPLFLLPGAILEERPSQFSLDGVCNSSEEMRPTSSQPNLPHVIKSVKQEMRKNLKNMNSLTKVIAASPEKITPGDDSEDAIVDIGSFTGVNEWELPERWDSCFIVAVKTNLKDALVELDRAMRHDKNCDYSLISKIRPSTFGKIQVSENEIALWSQDDSISISIQAGHYLNISKRVQWIGNFEINKPIRASGLLACYVSTNEAAVVIDPENRVFVARSPGFAAYSLEGSLQLVEFVDLKDFGKDSECYERLLDGSRGALLGWKKNVFSTNGSEIPVATFYAVPKTSLLFLKRGSQLLQLKSGIHVITNPENAFHGFFLTEGTAKFPTKPVYTTDGIEVVMEVNLEYRLDSALLLAANYSSPLEALVTPTQSAVHALVSRLTYQQFQRSQRAEGEAPSKNEGWLDELKSATLEELQKEAQLLGIHVSMDPQDPTTPTDNRRADEAEFRSPQLAPQKQMNLKVSTNAAISSLSADGRTPQTTSALTASPQNASPRRRSNSFTASEINSRKHWELPSPQIVHPTIIDNPIEYHTNIPELKPPVFIEETEESSHEKHQLASAEAPEAPEAAVTLPKFQETIEELLANEKWLIDEITQKNKELELQTRLSNESQLKLARVERALLRSESRLSSPTHKDKALSPTNCERGAFLSPGGASFGRLCSISAENLPRFSSREVSDGSEERNRKQDTAIGQNSTARQTESESHSPSSTSQLQQNNNSSLVPLESYQLLQTKLSECESTLLELEGNEKWLLEEITGKDEEIRRLNEQVLRLANKVGGLEKQMGNKDRTIAKLQSDAATTQSKLETMLAERETMRLADDRLKKTQEADTKLLKTRIVEMEKEAIQKEEKLNSLQHQLRELEDCLKKANQENETSKLSIHQFENALLEATAHLKTDPKQGLHLKRLDDSLEPVVSSLETNLVVHAEVEQVPTAFEISPPTSTDKSHHIDVEQTLKTYDGTMTNVTDAHENGAFSGELPSREQTTSSDSCELRELRTTPHTADGNNTTRCSPEARSDCSELIEARICESLQNAENETKDSDEQSGAEFSAQAQAFSDLMAAAVEIVSALREAEPLIVSAIGQMAERHDRVAEGLEIALISPPGPLEEMVIPTVSEKEKIAFEEMAVYCNQLKAAIDAINSSDSRSRVINEENCQKLVKSEQANSDLQNNLSILQNDLSILQQQYSNERARNANAPSVDEVVTFQRRLSEVERQLAESLDGEKLEKRTHGLELILQQLEAKSGLKSEQTSALIDRIRELEAAICSKLDGLSQLEHEWSRYLTSPMEDCRSDSLPATMSCESNSNLSKLHVLEADGETLFVREVRLSEPAIHDNAPPESISSSAAEVFCDAQQSAAASCGDLLEIKPSRLSEPLQTHMYHLEENQYSLDDLLASLEGEHFPTLSPDNQPSPTLSLESGIFESEASTNVTRRESDQLGVIAQHSLDVGETGNAGLKTPVGVRKSVKPSDALAHHRYEPYV
ncbi:hypothetical protein HDU77_009198, partial [Chytriomyces hyalinus]